MSKSKKNDLKVKILESVAGVEIQPYMADNQANLAEYQQFSLSQISALGLAFEPLAQHLQKAGSNGSTNQLYRVILPRGAHLAQVHNESAFIGAAIKDGKGLVGQARFVPVEGNGVVPPLNPAMICMAIALVNVNQKLGNIQEASRQIIVFLEEREKAKLEGNLEILLEIFNNFKYNLDNQLYKTNKHVQVQGIKSEAEQGIKLYRSQIEAELKKQSALHGDHNVQGKISQLEKIYKNYQLALYAYTFAYFLEVMLFENFDKDYLESVTHSIEKHSEEYGTLYQKTCQVIERYSRSSMQACAIKTLSGLSKGAGKVVAKIPLIRQTQLDENLIAKGELLEQSEESRAHQVLESIFAGDTDFVAPFIENIRMIKLLYNDTLEVLLGGDTLYIKNA